MQDGTYVMTEEGMQALMKLTGYWVALEEVELSSVQPGEIVGVWTDQLTGKVWIDKSMHVEDLTMAMSFGKLYKQKAIYDIANEKVLQVA
jgi:multidrug resistance efflux pump